MRAEVCLFLIIRGTPSRKIDSALAFSGNIFLEDRYPQNIEKRLKFHFQATASNDILPSPTFGLGQAARVVLRGGSWNNNLDNASARNRNRNNPNNPNNWNNNNGFRVVLVVSVHILPSLLWRGMAVADQKPGFCQKPGFSCGDHLVYWASPVLI